MEVDSLVPSLNVSWDDNLISPRNKRFAYRQQESVFNVQQDTDSKCSDCISDCIAIPSLTLLETPSESSPSSHRRSYHDDECLSVPFDFVPTVEESLDEVPSYDNSEALKDIDCEIGDKCTDVKPSFDIEPSMRHRAEMLTACTFDIRPSVKQFNEDVLPQKIW